MRVSVVTFPGSNCDQDAVWAFGEILGVDVTPVWHKSHDLANPDLVFIPGGFSFGDYLRSGAIARFSPIMNEVAQHYRKGGYVMGICNGFQILCEMGILPGCLMKNRDLAFLCQDVYVRCESSKSPLTYGLSTGTVLNIPIAHGMGRYVADDDTLRSLEDHQQVVFRYTTASGELTEEANPNGSLNAIAGICDESGRALGMMPHPERHVESALGSDDGLQVLGGLIEYLEYAAT
ncbi:MAG: phosphoribosylformylglycinamidine synthase subunit PurQ [Acidobacteria bacterium]|nr:phosphoribosylformylglycinamidine synthase subunit PurQ [Acidobacteriota bacterium]